VNGGLTLEGEEDEKGKIITQLRRIADVLEEAEMIVRSWECVVKVDETRLDGTLLKE
jgi:hypothetical protein